MASSRLRLRAAALAAHRSPDRSMLDLLLKIGDLPPGWHQHSEKRYRVGFTHNTERDKRAREQKLVQAVRTFAAPEALSWVVALLSPAANEEDAHARLAAGPAISWEWVDLIRPTKDESEVTAPPEAGEHARAFLTTITPKDDVPGRDVQVVWVEPGRPILGAVLFRGPTVLDAWAFTSMLIQCQRERLAQVAH